MALAPLGGIYYSGRRPLSERGSTIAYRLITKLNSRVSLWFHQHLELVDDSGRNFAVERRFARRAGLRLARLTREPGSTAFVVELPAGALAQAAVSRFAGTVLDVAAAPVGTAGRR